MDEVDSQHKLLFGLINDLHDAIVRRQADATLTQVLPNPRGLHREALPCGRGPHAGYRLSQSSTITGTYTNS